MKTKNRAKSAQVTAYTKQEMRKVKSSKENELRLREWERLGKATKKREKKNAVRKRG